MDFKITFKAKPPLERFNYNQPMFLTGSCFADNISELLQKHRFNVFAQPNGVVYNPISIAQHLMQIGEDRSYSESDIFFNNELYHTWQHHSQYSYKHPLELLQNINSVLHQAHQFIHQPNVIVYVTLGSAFVYQLIDNPGFIVANCHKYPQQKFTKRLLQVAEIVDAFNQLKLVLPNAQFVFTVSPVRHIKDGLVENNVSKGILLQAIYELCNNSNWSYYFPAYEMVIDELRDYRFFGNDLVHPNQLAIDYVWQQFVHACFDDISQQLVSDLAAYNAMQNHRIMHEGTTAHQKFMDNLMQKKTSINQKYFNQV